MRSVRTNLIITFIILVVVCCCQGCKVQKQIQNTDTDTQIESKSDSSANVKNDITKESETKTVITEEFDSTLNVAGIKAKVKGDTTLSDGTTIDFKDGGVVINQPDKKIPVKGKRRTETTERAKEVDKSKVKTEVKKAEVSKVEFKEVSKDIKKTGFPWWSWLILVVLLGGYMAWRFRSSWLPQSK